MDEHSPLLWHILECTFHDLFHFHLLSFSRCPSSPLGNNLRHEAAIVLLLLWQQMKLREDVLVHIYLIPQSSCDCESIVVFWPQTVNVHTLSLSCFSAKLRKKQQTGTKQHFEFAQRKYAAHRPHQYNVTYCFVPL